MMDTALLWWLLLILPCLVAGVGESCHKEGRNACKLLARREVLDYIKDEGARPGKDALPLEASLRRLRGARTCGNDMLGHVRIRLVRVCMQLASLRRHEVQELRAIRRRQSAVQ